MAIYVFIKACMLLAIYLSHETKLCLLLDFNLPLSLLMIKVDPQADGDPHHCWLKDFLMNEPQTLKSFDSMKPLHFTLDNRKHLQEGFPAWLMCLCDDMILCDEFI